MRRKLMKRYWLVGWVVGLLVCGWLAKTAVPLFAQDNPVPTPIGRDVSDDEVNAIAKDLYCPVCENTPLDVCGTQACDDWRELIRTKLAAGESPQDIFNYFARQYGSGVLAAPPPEGISLLLWLLPVAAVALGLIFFARYMHGLRLAAKRGNTAVLETADSLPPDDYANRIEQELRR
jgi:cytochrome c-type biogenesis protein CcmH